MVNLESHWPDTLRMLGGWMAGPARQTAAPFTLGSNLLPEVCPSLRAVHRHGSGSVQTESCIYDSAKQNSTSESWHACLPGAIFLKEWAHPEKNMSIITRVAPIRATRALNLLRTVQFNHPPDCPCHVSPAADHGNPFHTTAHRLAKVASLPKEKEYAFEIAPSSILFGPG